MSVSAASGPQEFRKFAEDCLQIAERVPDSDQRARLTVMAQAWRRLAEEADRFEELIREMDQAFDLSAPGEAAGARRHVR
jgi:hypothetical protein